MVDKGDHSDHNSELALIGELLLVSFLHLDPVRMNIRKLVLVERHLVIHSRLI
jgi:hypothetical protein